MLGGSRAKYSQWTHSHVDCLPGKAQPVPTTHAVAGCLRCRQASALPCRIYNNLLTVIIGNAELVLHHGSGEEDIREILSAAERAAALTSQLLAFSRKQLLEKKVVNLNGIVSSVEKMLRSLVGEALESRPSWIPRCGPSGSMAHNWSRSS